MTQNNQADDKVSFIHATQNIKKIEFYVEDKTNVPIMDVHWQTKEAARLWAGRIFAFLNTNRLGEGDYVVQFILEYDSEHSSDHLIFKGNLKHVLSLSPAFNFFQQENILNMLSDVDELAGEFIAKHVQYKLPIDEDTVANAEQHLDQEPSPTFSNR